MRFIDHAHPRAASILTERPVNAGRARFVAVTCSDTPALPVSRSAEHSAHLTETVSVSAFLNLKMLLRHDPDDHPQPHQHASDFSACGSDAASGARPCGWQIPMTHT